VAGGVGWGEGGGKERGEYDWPVQSLPQTAFLDHLQLSGLETLCKPLIVNSQVHKTNRQPSYRVLTEPRTVTV
jgi:hypothetical protein